MSRRIVFDTATVVSALLFPSGRLTWLRQHWRDGHCIPLASRATVAELTRVLAYPKFQLSPESRHELLAEYLPFCEILEDGEPCGVVCRDAKDQPFLNLAHFGHASALVSSDNDLLVLAGQTKFLIETPEAYRQRLLASPQTPPGEEPSPAKPGKPE